MQVSFGVNNDLFLCAVLNFMVILCIELHGKLFAATRRARSYERREA
jgi:hypothetical protein